MKQLVLPKNHVDVTFSEQDGVEEKERYNKMSLDESEKYFEEKRKAIAASKVEERNNICKHRIFSQVLVEITVPELKKLLQKGKIKNVGKTSSILRIPSQPSSWNTGSVIGMLRTKSW